MKKSFYLFIGIIVITACRTDGRMVTQESVTDTSFEGSYLYERFRNERTEGPVIPGLLEDLVPQGMAFRDDRNEIVISNYSSEGRAGALSFLSMESEELTKVLFLENSDETPHKGHLGGLAIGGDYLWIASGRGVFNVSLKDLDEKSSGDSIALPDLIPTETKGSFASFHDGYVWVGEFTRANGDYPVPSSHWRERDDGKSNRAWLGAYLPEKLLNSNDTVYPDLVISIPDEVQGVAFSGEGIIFSMSFGRKNYSRLEVYGNPLSEEADGVLAFPSAETASIWILDGSDLLDEVVVPPMSEALAKWQGFIAVLFESGASKYRDTALFPLDRIQLIPQNRLGE